MSDLQDHLFAAIEAVRSKEMQPEAAKAIAGLGKTLLDSAKVELEYMKLTDRSVASSTLLSSVGDADLHRIGLEGPLITYKCINGTCDWSGQQKEKLKIKNGESERRVCPVCKKEKFQMLVNGVPEAEVKA